MFDIVAGGILIILSMALAMLFKCKIEKCFPITIMSIIIIIYITGILGNMSIGFWIIIVSLVIAVFLIGRNRKSIVWNDVFTLGTIYFVLGIIFAIVQHRYSYPETWDELAQWALSPRYSYMTNQFGAVAGSNCIYPDYPPATAIFHYFWMRIGNSYQDNRLYISMSILIIGFMAPMTARFNPRKNFLVNIGVIGALYLAPFTFYSNAYSSLTVDCLLGVVFAYLFFTIMYENNSYVKWTALLMGVFVLSLVKASGIIFAMIIILILFVNEMNYYKKEWYLLVGTMVTCCAAKLSWNEYLRIFKTNDTWKIADKVNVLSWEMIADWEKKGFYNFYKALFNYKAIENTSQTEFWMFVFKIPCIVWVLFLIIMFVLICQKNKEVYKRICYVLLMAGLAFYICATSLLYLTSFGEGEVAILSSFNRYLGSYLLAMYLILLYVLLSEIKIQKIYGLVLFFLIPHIVFQNTIFNFVNMSEKKKDKEARVVFEKDICQIENYIKEKSVLHVFNGDIAGTNYALTPNKVASPLWQSTDFGYFETFAKSLGYEYVFLDDIYGTVETKEFKKAYGSCFDNVSDIMDRGLYEVYYEGDIPKLRFLTYIERIE